MKKYIFTILVFSCLSGMAYAQTEAQQELKAYMNEGLLNMESRDGKYSFRVGGRLMIDGAHYIDDYTDRSSGLRFGEARIRMFSTLGNKLDIKFDVDFAHGTPELKDVYLRWHSNKQGFFRLGNFTEPFSPENIQSNYEDHFINKSATTDAFGTGRALGISYRYYHPYFWGEAGAFSQKYTTLSTNGDMGYGLSARVLGRYTSDDFNIHAGAAINFRRPDANGFTNGSDDFNRTYTVNSTLESAVDKKPMIGGTIANVKNVVRYGAELMMTYRMVYLTGEYQHATFNRERDWEYNFAAMQGSLMGSMFPTLDQYKAALGGDWALQMYGYTIQAGALLCGGDYRYSKVDALVGRPAARSLELVLRYNFTNLTDIKKGSLEYKGNFYDNATWQDFGLTNGSWAGGKVNTVTVGLNYYITNTLHVKVNYGYQKLNNRYNYDFSFDKNLHSIQARVAFEF